MAQITEYSMVSLCSTWLYLRLGLKKFLSVADKPWQCMHMAELCLQWWNIRCLYGTIAKVDWTYRYILKNFFSCNYRCRYTPCWLNRIFSSSITNCPCLTHTLAEISSSMNTVIGKGSWMLRGWTGTQRLSNLPRLVDFQIFLLRSNALEVRFGAKKRL